MRDLLTLMQESHALVSEEDAEDQLPLELWGKVFSFLEPKSQSSRPSRCRDIDFHADLAAQRSFLQLPLVCQAFREVLHSDFGIPLHAAVCLHPPARALSSLLNWLQAHACKLQSICVCRKADQKLEMLANLCVCVKSATLLIHPQQQLQAVAGFQQLTACTLQLLPNLRGLVLKHGHFCNLSFSNQVSGLQVTGCEAMMLNSGFSMLLHSLYIRDSTIHNIRAEGPFPSDAPSLKCLTVINSNLWSISGVQCLCTEGRFPVRMPECISQLSNLKTLHIQTTGQNHSICEADWLYDLTALKSLTLMLNSQSSQNE